MRHWLATLVVASGFCCTSFPARSFGQDEAKPAVDSPAASSAPDAKLKPTAGVVPAEAKSRPVPNGTEHSKLDWSDWRKLPVLDDGRIKPLDTKAIETVLLVTDRSYWVNDAVAPPRRYSAAELYFAWMVDQDTWAKLPVIRCEYRPLRKELGLDEKGMYVALDEIINWDESKKNRDLVFRDPKVKERFQRVQREAGNGQKSPGEIGDSFEERRLNKQVGDLIRHMMAFLGIANGKELYVAPGLDPQALKKQVEVDRSVKPWVTLEQLIDPEEAAEMASPTFVALLSDSPIVLTQRVAQLAELFRGSGRAPTIPLSSLPQLAKAIPLRSTLNPVLNEIKPAYDAVKSAYLSEKTTAAEFSQKMYAFVSRVEKMAIALDEARSQMAPPEKGKIDFGPIDKQVWEIYEPVPLDEPQLAQTGYANVVKSTLDLELLYNRIEPFYVSCWLFGIALLAVLTSTMVKAQRTTYFGSLVLTGIAIGFATWGFYLRIAIAGRPPVTNMYETVIWVSYVTAVLGFFFGLLPQTSHGLKRSFGYTAIPHSWEDDPAFAGSRSAAEFGLMLVTTTLRAAGAAYIFWLSTMSQTTYNIVPLINADGYLDVWQLFSAATASNANGVAVGSSFGQLMVKWIGLSMVLISGWYVPRLLITLVLAPFVILSDLATVRRSFREGPLDNRLFVISSMFVATFGMLLAYFVGMYSPGILNPRIGPITAVLRHNYWLTIHVLTIVSSYGAGALCWGLGNLAMCYYLFGKYPRVRAASANDAHRPARSDAAASTTAAPSSDISSDSATDADTLATRLAVAREGMQLGNLGKTVSAGLRTLGTGDSDLRTAGVRPPAETADLASFGYRAMQIAALLLAAGTILGGLWADVSWGRFWDWDPKETWALVSLLCYIAFMHARFAGLVGTFGTNVGSVLCFQAIVMSWYGVNFVLPQVSSWLTGKMPESVGMHSYAGGDVEITHLVYVGGAVAANLLLVFAAWSRYVMETKLLHQTAASAKSSQGAVISQEARPVGT